MRLALSNNQITNADGTLNHKYFSIKKADYWDEVHDKALYRGL